MTEQDTSQTGQGAGSGDPQGGTAGSGAGTGQGADPGTQGDQGTGGDAPALTAEQIAELQTKADRAVADAAKYRRDLRAAQQQIEDAKRGSETEQERAERERGDLAKRADTAESRVRDLSLALAAHRVGAKLDLVDAEDAIALLLRQPDVALDDDGLPVDLESQLTKLVEAKPWLRKSAATTAGPARPTGGASAAPASQSSASDDVDPGYARLQRAYGASG